MEVFRVKFNFSDSDSKVDNRNRDTMKMDDADEWRLTGLRHFLSDDIFENDETSEKTDDE